MGPQWPLVLHPAAGHTNPRQHGMHAQRRLLILLALTVPCWPCWAQSSGCEDLKTSIEAKIRARGVAHFGLSILEENAPASGQVVGSCERGTKKIVYTPRAPSAGTAQADAPRVSRSQQGAVITECLDGRVIGNGSCKR